MKRLSVGLSAVVLIILTVAIVTAGASGKTSSKSSKSPIVIGDLAALTGANVVEPPTTLVPTLRAWVADVNANGGINGHPIKLIVDDDQGIAANAIADLQTLIQTDHIAALVGVFDSLAKPHGERYRQGQDPGDWAAV